MRNPWSALGAPNTARILEIDQDAIRGYNEKQRTQATRIIQTSIPEPFIGNPQSARLVLLNLSPGHSTDDAIWHADRAFRDAMLRNLLHEDGDYPFYPLNPAFRDSGGEGGGNRSPNNCSRRGATKFGVCQAYGD